jgi:hypothetical protein
MDSTLEGLDGFSFQQSDRLAPLHLLLNEYVAEPVTDFERFVPDSKWKKLPKRQSIELIEAVLQRLNWLFEHDAELRDAHFARLKLIKLLRQLYTRKLPCNETDLRMMLQLTVPLLDHISPDGPVDYVMEYIKENDLSPDLCSSLHNFQANLLEAGSVASMQSLRQRLHTLLFMDEWEPLNPAHCWSECIRRDFRAMTGERRMHWRQVLKHIRGNAPQNMPASWAREAEVYLASVGVDDFVEQLSLWFAPFRSGQPLPLSVAGSHILKGLIWYAAVSRDERAREIALWLLDVKWKQKKNMTKSMVALGALGVSKEELLSRGLISEQKIPTPRIMETMIQIFRTPNAGTHIVMDQDGDLIVVQGQLHFYRLFRSSGRIERVTDNAQLELDWTAIPDSERLYLSPECNSEDQLHRRAVMLMCDSIYGKYFKQIGK